MQNFALIAGLLASILHVITGPDHMAAVLPFAIETKRKAWKIGLIWAIGHLFGMTAIGLLFVLFKSVIPVQQISNYSEQLIGVVLIGIGAWAIYKIFRSSKGHKHLHIHSENAPIIHKHKHSHNDFLHHKHEHPKDLKQSSRVSFWIGVLHGFAGIAHFLILLPVLGFDSNLDSGFYIIGFAIGIVLAMTVFAFVIGQISYKAQANHNEYLINGIRLGGGLIALIIGVYWSFSV